MKESFCTVVLRAPGLESERTGVGETEGKCRSGARAAARLRGRPSGETEAASHLLSPLLAVFPFFLEEESDIRPKFDEVWFSLVNTRDTLPSGRGSTWGH